MLSLEIIRGSQQRAGLRPVAFVSVFRSFATNRLKFSLNAPRDTSEQFFQCSINYWVIKLSRISNCVLDYTINGVRIARMIGHCENEQMC